MQQSANPSLIVTFDLGGVIVRVCPTPELAAQRAGVPWRKLRHEERRDEVQKLLFEWQIGQMTDDALFEAWADALGGRFDAEEARRMSSSWLMGEYEGMRDIAQRIHDKGIRMGCLSNTCDHHWRHMLDHPEEYPTLALFTERYGSHMLGFMKPDPRIFAKYESAVGATGNDVVYFDDAPENVDAALGRGWRAHCIRPDRSPREQVEEVIEELLG